MHKLLTQLKERRIWRVLIAYPSMTFVLLQVVEFFINNYELDARYLTAGIILAAVLLPAAVLWNWRHGEVGQQPIAKTEVGTYLVSALTAVAAVAWYWSATPADLRTARQELEPARSVAVMPFENIGGDADVQYLCDGIAESLINWLATIPDVRVVSKGAAFRLRDKTHDMAALAAELGVDSVIFGDLKMDGDKVLVSASMVDVRNDSQIWGARMVQPSEDVIYLERSIVAAIKDGLRLKVTDDADALIASGGTDNPKAYEHYQRGHYLIQSTNGESINQGLDELRLAIRADPKFARPYADIADTLSQMLSYGVLEGGELLGEARNAAFTAVALAPDLAEAHTALATIHQYFDFDWEAADAAYESAIALPSQNPAPFHRYTDYLVLTFRFEKAKEMAARAVKVDPLDGSSMHAVGLAYLSAGDFTEAAEAFGKWNRFHPGSRWSYVKHALALSLDGQCDAALDQAEKVEAMNNGKVYTLLESWLAWGYKVCGNDEWYARSKQRIEDAHELNPDPYDPGLAYLHALEGNAKALTEQFEAILDERKPFVLFARLFTIDYLGWGISGKMSSNSRYAAMIESLNFPPGDSE